nr:ral-GDS-related protein-like isoform X6 [Equus asinus]
MRKSSQKFKNLCMKDQRVSRKLLMEEVASLWKALEMGPWGAQERQQQQGMVPFLGAFLDYLQLLDTEIEDYLQKFQVIKEIQLLQEAANECHLQPEE